MDDRDIVFVTTSLNTKWIKYQSDIIKNLFPLSTHVIINGSTYDFRSNWPNSWFRWIDAIKNRSEKYYINLDEDFFITSRDEIIRCIIKMEDEDIHIMGCSDGYHQYRFHNPVALNPFFMIGRVEDLCDMYNKCQPGILYKEEYRDDFIYEHDIMRESTFDNFEPFYCFFWKLKDKKLKFSYLYPHFDDRFKSTNPRVDKDSPDIGIHMWYIREWNSSKILFGMSNIDRYNKLEEEILKPNQLNQ